MHTGILASERSWTQNWHSRGLRCVALYISLRKSIRVLVDAELAFPWIALCGTVCYLKGDLITKKSFIKKWLQKKSYCTGTHISPILCTTILCTAHLSYAQLPYVQLTYPMHSYPMYSSPIICTAILHSYAEGHTMESSAEGHSGILRRRAHNGIKCRRGTQMSQMSQTSQMNQMSPL